jgi:hypothetical protein
MQAIETKYMGATTYRGIRVQATCAAKTTYVPWRDELTPEQNHVEAALYLAEQLKWIERNDLKSGCLRSGNYCHVLVEKLT